MRAYWKNVVLVEWIWAGHHPMYFSFFVRALLDLGCSVVAFCPKPDEVDSALNDLSAEARSRLTLHYFEWVPSPNSTGTLQTQAGNCANGPEGGSSNKAMGSRA